MPIVVTPDLSFRHYEDFAVHEKNGKDRAPTVGKLQQQQPMGSGER